MEAAGREETGSSEQGAVFLSRLQREERCVDFFLGEADSRSQSQTANVFDAGVHFNIILGEGDDGGNQILEGLWRKCLVVHGAPFFLTEG